jgi:hypothetical protein
MFTIVVPTMWKYPPFIEFLYKLVALDLISEINIINNAIGDTPNDAILNNPKIKMNCFDKNIFVNPAWNYGVATAKTDQICIMNDDIDFDTNIFELLQGIISPGSMATISTEPATTGEIELKRYYKGMHVLNGGTLMFIHRKDWIDIPAGLDFLYGDNWIWETMMLRNNIITIIDNIKCYTPMSVTMKDYETETLNSREGFLFGALLTNFKRRMEQGYV